MRAALVAAPAAAALVLLAVVAARAAPIRPAAHPSGVPAGSPAAFLSLAESDLARTRRAFLDPRLGWYDERLSRTPASKPLASLWSAFPLFEALDAVAIADPTTADKLAVRAFARGAERYYNPDLRPVGGYAYYPGTRNPAEHTYFDDNGWWELAFLDAFRATGDWRDVRDAERAFRFIAVSGWDREGGGVWWETLHLHKTSEPLAAEIYSGLVLFRITGIRSYLETADKLLAWADARSWNRAAGLYGRNESDGTVLDYVEGLMIGAQLELCTIRHIRGPCSRAEALARASVEAFPHYADWTPAADMIYLRFMLELAGRDHGTVWYRLVHDNAERVLRDARSGDGLFFKRWDGRRFPTRLLQPDAAALALFAWLGGAKPPGAP